MTNRRELADRLEQDAIGDLRHCIAIASQEQPGWRSTWEEALTVITARILRSPDPLLEEAVELLRRTSDDLHSEVTGRYGDDIHHYPGIKRKFDADMEIVTEAQAFLSRLDAEREESE